MEKMAQEPLWKVAIFAAAHVVGPVYHTSGLVLMWLTGRILAAQVERLVGQLRGLSDDDWRLDGEVVAHHGSGRLAALQATVCRWNGVFGAVLFFNTVSVFVNFVLSTFCVVLQPELDWQLIVSVAGETAKLWAACHAVHAVEGRAADLCRLLSDVSARLWRPHPAVRRLAESAQRWTPTVTACGFFQIHRRLFPTVRNALKKKKYWVTTPAPPLTRPNWGVVTPSALPTVRNCFFHGQEVPVSWVTTPAPFHPRCPTGGRDPIGGPLPTVRNPFL